jgi:aspartate carbamoyltransferase catalytic subunit
MNTEQLIQRLLELRAQGDLETTDLVSIDQLSTKEILRIFEMARIFRELKTEKLDFLKGSSVGLAFFESSTRTKSSFDWSGKHLGADVVAAGSGTAEKKGESMFDVLQVLDAMQPKVAVVRTSFSGLPQQLSHHTSASIINAGDGIHEHPTQALLDGLTMIDELGTLEGKIVTIVGDISHSRVFGSLARMLKKLGVKIRVAAPATLLLEKGEEVFGVEYFYDVEEALKDADVVYALRIQNERGATGDIPTVREYSKAYGISPQRFALAKKGAILMHPGPIQRDTDVHHVLVGMPESRILHQVENGLAIRKTVVWLLGSRTKEKEFTRV